MRLSQNLEALAMIMQALLRVVTLRRQRQTKQILRSSPYQNQGAGQGIGFNVLRATRKNAKVADQHTRPYREYLDRLLFQQKYLRGMKLNDLYYQGMWENSVSDGDR
jgi:hypothetical protein